jgi:hypothetical protein
MLVSLEDCGSRNRCLLLGRRVGLYMSTFCLELEPPQCVHKYYDSHWQSRRPWTEDALLTIIVTRTDDA